MHGETVKLMDAKVYPETSTLTSKTTQRHILKERRQNLRSHKYLAHIPKQFWNERAEPDLHERSR